MPDDRSLLDGEQVAVGAFFVADIVKKRHQEIQLCPRPKVVRVLLRGGVLDDGVRHGLHELSLLIQATEAVPTVGVLHVEEIDRLDIVFLLFELLFQ